MGREKLALTFGNAYAWLGFPTESADLVLRKVHQLFFREGKKQWALAGSTSISCRNTR